jgi:hypothetical protein
MVLLLAALSLLAADPPPPADAPKSGPDLSPPVRAEPPPVDLERPGEVSSSGHTLLNTEPDAPEPALLRQRKARLLEIDQELEKLTHPRTPRQAFGEAFTRLMPFWVVAAAPVVVLGALKVDSDTASQGTQEALDWALGLAAGAMVVMVSYCVMVAIGAWLDEVPAGFDREKKIGQLTEERRQLAAQVPAG